MRLIDADELKKQFSTDEPYGAGEISIIIDNAPTVNLEKTSFMKGYNYGCDDGKRFYERPQGQWIEKVERRGCFAGDKTVYSYTCPFCGVKEFKKYPFCHCGADMRGKEK